MIRVYAESPFVLQLVLRQEHRATCDALVEIARVGTIELVLPVVAFIEPLGTLRLRASKRQESSNAWRAQARELARSDHQSDRQAAEALENAILSTAQMTDEERRRLDDVTAQVGSVARLLSPSVADFRRAYALEQKGATGVDALAMALIVSDATTHAVDEHALLSLDEKSIPATITAELKASGMKVFTKPDELRSWLRSKSIELSSSTSVAPTAAADGTTGPDGAA